MFMVVHARVIFINTRWVIERSWFPRDDLGNLIYSEVALEAWLCLVQVAYLGVQVLGTMRAVLILG